MVLPIDTLRAHFSGDILTPGSADYDHAATVLVRKGAPALIVRPKSAADIAAAIQFATQNSLMLSIKSGGHSMAGHSTNDGGMVIDLMHLNEVEVLDKAKHLVRIGAGGVWGDVAKKLQKHHLAISSGDTTTVGVGGLTLGAGVGWMVRKYGLAIDNLAAAEVVTANGRVLRASKDENSDLFWAIRGGGGNFGIVTHFEFYAHPVGQVYAGNITYNQDNLAAKLKAWRDYMRVAPEELTTMFVTLPSFGPDMPASVIIMCCYAGDNEAQAMKVLDPLLHLGDVLDNDIAKKDYADVLEEANQPPGVKVVVNNAFIREFTDEIIDLLAKQTGQILQIRSVGGAMNRVKPDATAFPHRDNEVLIISPVFLDPNATQDQTDAALAPWRETAKHASGVYISFFSQSTAKELADAYPGETFERLVKIKQKYDPNNVFNQNYNIKPKN